MMSWAFAEMQGAMLWDRRCNRSMARICERRFELPHVSFSRACGDDGRQAAHRIFGNAKTTVSGLLAGHFEQTRARCEADYSQNHQGPQERILVVQDTTVFKYTSHVGTEGLGPIHTSEKGRGLLSHAAIALPRTGPPLGVVHLSIWARDPADHGKRRDSAARTKDPLEIKESQKWIDGMWGAEATLPNTPLLVICDREADIFELFAAERREQTELLVRSRHPRRILVEGDSSPVLLADALDSAPVLGTMTVEIPRAAKRPARRAVLQLRARKVTLKPPTTLPAPLDGSKHPNQTLFVIEARETRSSAEAATDAAEPIHWVLLTTMPVRAADEAAEMVHCYTRRWVIEEVHLVLKSGLRAEQLQFDDAHSLKNALAALYVIAWRVVQTRDLARFFPDAPAGELVTEEEQQILEAAEGRPLTTARDVARAIAHLGGFPRYRSAGEPGVRSLCACMQRLEAIIVGWRLAKQQSPL
jgi:hypothetical protein